MVDFRAAPEDFEVTELPLYEPCGEGEHLFLWVEKRDRTTEQVASLLARSAGAASRDVGYAGRKDRRAVTRQWFSLPLRAGATVPELSVEGVRVLQTSRHRNKLRTGHLAGNRFRLRLHDIVPATTTLAAQRLQQLARFGFANRFGVQRFGRAGDNARAGEEVWRRGTAGGDRRAARFLVSALQAEVFNETLDRRSELTPDATGAPGDRAIDRMVAGDVAVVHASGGPFMVEDPEREQARAEALEISPTGPIFGDRMRPAGGAVAALEASVLEARGIDPRRRVAGIRASGARRSLRARVLDPALTALGQDQALLEVTLESGVYATELLAELFRGEVLREGGREPRKPGADAG
jgi:tRNA pseudouridine13 synthase